MSARLPDGIGRVVDRFDSNGDIVDPHRVHSNSDTITDNIDTNGMHRIHYHRQASYRRAGRTDPDRVTDNIDPGRRSPTTSTPTTNDFDSDSVTDHLHPDRVSHHVDHSNIIDSSPTTSPTTSTPAVPQRGPVHRTEWRHPPAPPTPPVSAASHRPHRTRS